MDNELKAALETLGSEHKTAFTAVKTQLDEVKTGLSAVQRQADAIEVKMGRPGAPTSGAAEQGGVDLLVRNITENADFKALRESGRGRAVIKVNNPLEMKSTPLARTGLYTPQGLPGIGDAGRFPYGGVRRLMRNLPIDAGSAFFVRETSAAGINASPQTELADKNESIFAFEGVTAAVETIAHFTGVSKQAMADVVSLNEHIRGSLLWGLEKEFEEQILSGSGVSPNLEGLLLAPQSFDATLLNDLAAGGYNRADCLRAACLQLILSGYGCTGFVVHPTDWFLIECAKDAERRYVVGDPRRELSEILWSRPIVPSPAITAGTFLCGDFDSGAHLRMREDATVDISDSHSDWFIKNLLCLRAEFRAVLCITKPSAFVSGSFSSSPA